MSHRLLAAALAAGLLSAPCAQAAVTVTIDKSIQQMTVEVDGRPLYQWPVSTGKGGYDTPSGKFKAFRMERDHFSKEWDEAPMPFSIFFTQKGHAIHGSLDVKRSARRFAWLRAPAAGERRKAVCAGGAGRRAEHHRVSDRRRAVRRTAVARRRRCRAE
jgi:hypothetical protein